MRSEVPGQRCRLPSCAIKTAWPKPFKLRPRPKPARKPIALRERKRCQEKKVSSTDFEFGLPKQPNRYLTPLLPLTTTEKERCHAPILTGTFVAGSFSPTAAESGENYQPAVVGVWDLGGVDESNTRWIATLVLTQGKDNSLQGHIDWISNKGSCGRERVTSTYDPELRILKMVGIKVEFSDNVVRCTYRAHLSRDGSQLENGKWSDNDLTIPGTWNAKRIKLH